MTSQSVKFSLTFSRRVRRNESAQGIPASTIDERHASVTLERCPCTVPWTAACVIDDPRVGTALCSPCVHRGSNAKAELRRILVCPNDRQNSLGLASPEVCRAGACPPLFPGLLNPQRRMRNSDGQRVLHRRGGG